MHKNIPYVCDIISKPAGYQLLKLLAFIYEGVHDKEFLQKELGKSTLEQGINFDLLKPYKKGQLVLTTLGYFVANVAKEYCHWIDNNRRIPPPCPPEAFIEGKDVLDLGCSFGRWLWQFQKNARSVVGLEMQQEYIVLGQALAKRECIPCPEMLKGSAEELNLYVADNSVDFVFVRLVLNHVYVGKTLQQITNVLRSGGIVWAQVEPLSCPFRNFLQGNKGRELRHKLFAVFGILNSIVFITTHHQMSLRIKGRMHSIHKPVYPNLKAWKAAFARVGLCDFTEIQSSGTYVFWARKT